MLVTIGSFFFSFTLVTILVKTIYYTQSIPGRITVNDPVEDKVVPFHCYPGLSCIQYIGGIKYNDTLIFQETLAQSKIYIVQLFCMAL